MKTILQIAKAELQVLFYSPVAWLILVIFAFQSGIVYTSAYEIVAHRTIIGAQTSNLTYSVMTESVKGFFNNIQGYLYLYIPLLTMGVISREFSSGSIKLLYSSPIKSSHIVLGKYLALIIFSLVMIGIIGIFVLHSAISIDNFDYPVVLSALLGLFLLICAYAAVGLFMSSITSYTVISAIGTLAILALLNFVKGWFQDIEIVRDVTYWMAMAGRSRTFILGLITTEDVLYFLMVIFLFVTYTIIKLEIERKKTSKLVVSARYIGVFLIVCIVGYFSSLPKLKFYYDATYAKYNTLVEGSQKVVKNLEGPLTIHAYVNMLEKNFGIGVPKNYKKEIDRFEKYLRFKPEIKYKQTHYYHRTEYAYLENRFPNLTDKERVDSLRILNKWDFPIKSYDEINKDIDLSGEDFKYVYVLERENGDKVFLRLFDDMQKFPSEAEITAAFKRLYMDLPKIGFVTGHSERQGDSDKDRGYNMIVGEKSFRYSLLNQGFESETVKLNSEVPSDIRILIIADPRKEYSDEELKNLKDYIDRGGNMILAGEPESKDFMNKIVQPLGISFMEGKLAHADKKLSSDVIVAAPSEEAVEFTHHLAEMKKGKYNLVLSGAVPLQFDPSYGFTARTLFRTKSSGVWLEKGVFNEIDSIATFDPEMGETEDEYPIVMALSRNINDKEQKIVVVGDADYMSNGEINLRRKGTKGANYFFIASTMFWLSDGEIPIDTRLAPPIDNELKYASIWDWMKNVLKIGFPIILALGGVFIWLRRRGR